MVAGADLVGDGGRGLAQTGNGQDIADPPRLAKSLEAAAGAPQDALHAHVIDGDHKVDAGRPRGLEQSAREAFP